METFAQYSIEDDEAHRIETTEPITFRWYAHVNYIREHQLYPADKESGYLYRHIVKITQVDTGNVHRIYLTHSDNEDNFEHQAAEISEERVQDWIERANFRWVAAEPDDKKPLKKRQRPVRKALSNLDRGKRLLDLIDNMGK